jgi:hypothetical protein
MCEIGKLFLHLRPPLRDPDKGKSVVLRGKYAALVHAVRTLGHDAVGVVPTLGPEWFPSRTKSRRLEERLWPCTFSLATDRPSCEPSLRSGGKGDRQRRGAFRVGGTAIFFRESFNAFLCEGIRKSEFTSSNFRPQPHLHRRTFSVILIPPLH